jgi:hypothetical protein
MPGNRAGRAVGQLGRAYPRQGPAEYFRRALPVFVLFPVSPYGPAPWRRT